MRATPRRRRWVARWNHALFERHEPASISSSEVGDLREAFEGAQQSAPARSGGGRGTPIPTPTYDLAMACWLLGRVLRLAGVSEHALSLLDEARQRFETIAKDRSRSEARNGMASACFAEQGDCLSELGRLDEAATAYEESVRRSEQAQ